MRSARPLLRPRRLSVCAAASFALIASAPVTFAGTQAPPQASEQNARPLPKGWYQEFLLADNDLPKLQASSAEPRSLTTPYVARAFLNPYDPAKVVQQLEDSGLRSSVVQLVTQSSSDELSSTWVLLGFSRQSQARRFARSYINGTYRSTPEITAIIKSLFSIPGAPGSIGIELKGPSEARFGAVLRLRNVVGVLGLERGGASTLSKKEFRASAARFARRVNAS